MEDRICTEDCLSPLSALLSCQEFFGHAFRNLNKKGGGEIKEKSVGRLTRYSREFFDSMAF